MEIDTEPAFKLPEEDVLPIDSTMPVMAIIRSRQVCKKPFPNS